MMGQSLKTLQIVTALTCCLVSVGICFGFAALKPILIASNVYAEKCRPRTIRPPLHASYKAVKKVERETLYKAVGQWRGKMTGGCVEQELAMNQMFTWAAVMTNVSAFPIGLCLDHYGAKITSLVGAVLLFLGSLGMAMAAARQWDVWVVSYTTLATAGSFLLLSSFSLASLVPRKSGLIVSGMTGAFDASSGLFLIYRVVYERYGKPSLERFFGTFLVVPVVIFIVQVWYMPNRATDQVQSMTTTTTTTVEGEERRGESMTETTALLQSTEESRGYETLDKVVHDPLDGAMHAASNKDVLLSCWFAFPALVMIASLIRVNFYIATVHSQLIYFIGTEDAKVLMDAFDVLLPVGGLFAIPLIGWILDTYTTSTVYFLTFLLSAASGALSFVPNKYAQALHIITFVVLRPWIYSILPGTVTKLFGNERFGAFYGLIMGIAGLVNLLSHQLELLTYNQFKGSFVPVNAGLVGISVGMLAMTVAYMQYKIVRMDK